MSIQYTDSSNDEHIETIITPKPSTKYAWSAEPISAENIEHEGSWGRQVKVTFNYPQSNVKSSLLNCFSLTDNNGMVYTCTDGELQNGGINLILNFTDFNSSWNADSMSVIYSAPLNDGLQSPAVSTNNFTISFIPTNLERPSINPPVVVRIWNE